MNYIAYTGSLQIGEVVAMNDEQALALAKNKYPLNRVDRVEQQKMRVDLTSIREARKFDHLGLWAKLAAAAMIFSFGLLDGMKIERDRHHTTPKTEEIKATPVDEKPKVFITDLGPITKWEPTQNGEARVTTEHAVVYVKGEYPIIWTAHCKLFNDGQQVTFGEDGLPSVYPVTRQ